MTTIIILILCQASIIEDIANEVVMTVHGYALKCKGPLEMWMDRQANRVADRQTAVSV